MSDGRADTLLLSLGNPLRGDDGFGPAVVHWLSERGLPPHVAVLDVGAPAPELVFTLAQFRRVIVVDAADLGQAPGEWVRFTPGTARLEDSSLHSGGLANVLALGAALDLLPEAVVIYGAQPAQLDWSPGLSVEAQRAVPAVGRAVLKEIGSHDGQNTDH